MTRDQRILLLYYHGIDRKHIAYRLHSNYEIVKKVIQKHLRPERRRYPRPQVVGRVVVLSLS